MGKARHDDRGGWRRICSDKGDVWMLHDAVPRRQCPEGAALIDDVRVCRSAAPWRYIDLEIPLQMMG